MQTPHAVSDRSRSGTFDPDRFLTENDEDGFVADCAASYAASPLRLLLSKPPGPPGGLLGAASHPPANGGAGSAAAPTASANPEAAAQMEPQSQSSSGTATSQNPPMSPSTPETARGECCCLEALLIAPAAQSL